MGKELACPTMCLLLFGTLASSCHCFSFCLVNPKPVLEIQSDVGIQDASFLTAFPPGTFGVGAMAGCLIFLILGLVRVRKGCFED